jgi:hypothetical protein
VVGARRDQVVIGPAFVISALCGAAEPTLSSAPIDRQTEHEADPGATAGWVEEFLNRSSPEHVRNAAARDLHRSDPVELLDALAGSAPVWFAEYAILTKDTPREDIRRFMADRFVATHAASLLSTTELNKLAGGFDCVAFGGYVDALAGMHPVTPQESTLVYSLFTHGSCGREIEPAVVRFTIERGMPVDAARVASAGLGNAGRRVVREEISRSEQKPNAIIMAFFEPSIREPVDADALWTASKGSIPDSLRQLAYSIRLARGCTTADDYAAEADRLATVLGAAHAPGMLLLLAEPEIRAALENRYFETSPDGERRLVGGFSRQMRSSVVAAFSKSGRLLPVSGDGLRP